MTRTSLVVLAVVIAGESMLGALPAGAQRAGRLLRVGSASVVVAGSGGSPRADAAPRAAAAPRFRALPAQSKADLLSAAEAMVSGSPATAPVNRVAAMSGGVTLVAARSARFPTAGSAPRVATVPRFSPLSAAARADIVKAIATEAATTDAPAPTTPASAPFTLGITNLYVTDGAWLSIMQPDYISGGTNSIGFAGGKGFLAIIRIPATVKKYMLHFQLMNPTHATYEYTIKTGDGSTTKVSAKPDGVQDIVVFVSVPPNAYIEPTLAMLTGGSAQWLFLGVEVTPM